jgi:hypothetical protein
VPHRIPLTNPSHLPCVLLNTTDCWQSHARSADGQLQADAAKFPSGMSALSAHVHSKGLKFGIYGDAGSLTCAGYPGSRCAVRVQEGSRQGACVQQRRLIAGQARSKMCRDNLTGFAVCCCCCCCCQAP